MTDTFACGQSQVAVRLPDFNWLGIRPQAMLTTKTGKKWVALQTIDQQQVLIQLNGGECSPCAVRKKEKYTYLSYNVNETSILGWEKLAAGAIDVAIANKLLWWRSISNEQIKERMVCGHCNHVKIPMFGEVRTCDLQNADNTDMALRDLPGSKCDKIVLELMGFLFFHQLLGARREVVQFHSCQ